MICHVLILDKVVWHTKPELLVVLCKLSVKYILIFKLLELHGKASAVLIWKHALVCSLGIVTNEQALEIRDRHE